MTSAFKDHFSGHADDYRAFRPLYPAALVDVLADAAPGHDLAWDAGCGNGQLSGDLRRRFARVIATDASETQIVQAVPHDGVAYRVAPAERSGLPAAQADLIVAAQAAHWFDLPAFYAEAKRVGRPGAALALVSYGVLAADGEVGTLLRTFHDDTIGRWWPPERAHVDNGYRSLPFPVPERPVPPLSMAMPWTLAQVVGYLGTWSAVKAALKATGANPLDDFVPELAAAWGDPDAPRTIRWPLAVRLGTL
ncbi:class I SAM-dependent methyltransferase [Azospirillum sp.]|uniref:class I SAM-dependent methyltransferase n=1 Tax=Azospirillum sp. TaxID=34012 RepID=UPI003D75C686